MKIFISDSFDSSLPGRLAHLGEVITAKERLSEAEVLLIRSKTKANRDLLDQTPSLKMIIRGGVGLDNVDIDYARQKGIDVRNTPEASSVAVAELAFALMLAMPNQIVAGHNSMKEGRWLKKELKRTELMGKTLGLIGCGRIGREVAARAHAFGMRVLAYDVVRIEHPAIEQVASLEEMLPLCDYISLHTPLTPQTRGLVNSELIARMKNGVRIVNTSRGAVIVENDMVAALKSGKVAGYATDVFLSDPPVDCPLIDAPNVLLTPHIGASSSENLLRIGDQIVKILESYEHKN